MAAKTKTNTNTDTLSIAAAMAAIAAHQQNPSAETGVQSFEIENGGTLTLSAYNSLLDFAQAHYDVSTSGEEVSKAAKGRSDAFNALHSQIRVASLTIDGVTAETCAVTKRVLKEGEIKFEVAPLPVRKLILSITDVAKFSAHTSPNVIDGVFKQKPVVPTLSELIEKTPAIATLESLGTVTVKSDKLLFVHFTAIEQLTGFAETSKLWNSQSELALLDRKVAFRTDKSDDFDSLPLDSAIKMLSRFNPSLLENLEAFVSVSIVPKK